MCFCTCVSRKFRKYHIIFIAHTILTRLTTTTNAFEFPCQLNIWNPLFTRTTERKIEEYNVEHEHDTNLSTVHNKIKYIFIFCASLAKAFVSFGRLVFPGKCLNVMQTRYSLKKDWTDSYNVLTCNNGTLCISVSCHCNPDVSCNILPAVLHLKRWCVFWLSNTCTLFYRTKHAMQVYLRKFIVFFVRKVDSRLLDLS